MPLHLVERARQDLAVVRGLLVRAVDGEQGGELGDGALVLAHGGERVGEGEVRVGERRVAAHGLAVRGDGGAHVAPRLVREAEGVARARVLRRGGDGLLEPRGGLVVEALVVEDHAELAQDARVRRVEPRRLEELEGGVVELLDPDERAGVREPRLDVVAVEVDGPAEGVGRLDVVVDRRVGGAELEPGAGVVGLLRRGRP